MPSREKEPQLYADYLKERIYASFTGLAIVLVVSAGGHPDSRHALLALVLGVIGIVVAGLVADIVSHLLLHEHLPNRTEMAGLVKIAGGGLSTAGVPAILLFLAFIDVMDLHAALVASTYVYVITLALIGWLAVRRSKLTGLQRIVVLAVLVGLGFAVVGVQTLAKSV